jgi:hypothetical protein
VLLRYTEPCQMLMSIPQRTALENFKAKHGISYSFIVNQALKRFFQNLPKTRPKPYVSKVNYKRTLVRLTTENYAELQEYCQKNKTSMSAVAVYATMKYIEQ